MKLYEIGINYMENDTELYGKNNEIIWKNLKVTHKLFIMVLSY